MAAEVMQSQRYRRITGEAVATCPNCGNTAKLKRMDQRIIHPRLTSNLAPPLEGYAMEEAWTCATCDESLIQIMVYESGDTQTREPVEVRLLYPDRSPRSLPEAVPDSIASLYREASVAENVGALRGAAGLYRAAVEQLLTAQGISDGTLYKRIEDLGERDVSSDLVANLHEVRFLGNWSLHDGMTYSMDEVADVAELIADAVEELYVIPAKRAEMKAARAARHAGPPATT